MIKRGKLKKLIDADECRTFRKFLCKHLAVMKYTKEELKKFGGINLDFYKVASSQNALLDKIINEILPYTKIAGKKKSK